MLLESSQFVAGLGHIPTDWRVKTVDEISLKITKGTTPPKEDIVDHREIPFLRVNNLGFNGVLDQKSDFIFVSRKAHEGFLARSKAYPGDILMNIVGPPLGKVSLLGNDFAEYNMNQAIVIYRLQDDVIYRDYFLAYLLSDIAQQWLQSRSKKTSGQQNLTIELCKGLPVPIPAFVEQKKIAQILSTWDQAIATTECLLDLARQQKKALMQQLLTGKKRFREFDGAWKKITLQKLCAIKTGKKDVNEGNPEGIYPFFTCASEPTKSDSFSYDCEALLIAGNGMLGKTHYYNGKFEAYQRTYILSAFDEIINVAYLHQYVLYWLARDIEREKQHSAMPYIKLGLLQEFKVSVPSIEEQKRIALVLNSADQEIKTLQSQLDGLKQGKKALMQSLLSGKRRVQLNEQNSKVITYGN